ncbi:MAG: PIN domain-containing protein [Euryarchaeota archaeon]|nr:PIN domain-containing protein [Euryarchaeota archaeon]
MTMLDTSAVLDLLAGVPAAVAAYRDLEQRKDRVTVPTVVLYETRLVLGLRGARRKLARVERVLARMPRAPLDDSSALRAAEVGTRLTTRGAGIGPIDTLIAGTALAHSEPLLCSDPDFDRVPGLTVIRYR